MYCRSHLTAAANTRKLTCPQPKRFFSKKGSDANGKKRCLWQGELVNANVGGDLWTKRHDVLLLAISSELSFIDNVHKTDAYSVFEGRFGDGSEAASRLAQAFFAGDDRSKQGRSRTGVPRSSRRPCQTTRGQADGRNRQLLE